MPYIFNIDKSFIKALDDQTARELIARLCRAELRSQGLPESAVTWGGDQRAKDGGVDVRVDCPSPLRMPNFVKTAYTVFQVKAEKFPPSKIQEEMAPKGILRPAIVELNKTGGTYIIASTQDDFSDTALQPRRNAIIKCLRNHGIHPSVQSDFYDSRRIADWVELHPPITTWLRHAIGQPLKGWRPYGPWAYGEDDPKAEYLVDDRVRVFVPGAEEGSCITDTIAQLRQKLRNQVSIRIVGLSGVGKTRLVQALFDPRVCPESFAPPSENVIYVDLAEEPEPKPQTMLKSLQECGTDAIVVVDNCSPATHERLTEIVKSKSSHLKLITVEYDIREDLPEDTICYRLEGSSPEIITKLLKTRYRYLSESDADRIADFSDGNARVAFALASTVETGGELSQLRNQELFERLFQQKKGPNDELLRCAEAASILYSFDGSDASSIGEIARLATFAEVTPLTFLRHMTELERRGLLQKRGQWRAVLPHAIANGLARRLLQSVPGNLLYDALIKQGSERIARSFSRRLGFLHDCPEAIAIASQMLADDGMLGDLTALSDFEQQMFSNLAPVDPKSALNALKRATDKDNFLSTDNRNRSRFARVARAIAYEPEYFDDAISILKKLALTESEDYRREPVREILKSLFYCHLSGTQAGPERRRKIVEGLISSNDENERGLGLELIRAGLEAQHFSSHYGFEFGARRRDYGWHPRSQADVKAWFHAWIDLIATISEQDNAGGRKARAILGEALRGLWGRAGLDDELVNVARRLSAIDGWPEGWLGVRRILQWDAKSLLPASLAQLRELEKTLAPSDLVSEIRARVLARGTFAYDLDVQDMLEGKDDGPQSTSEKYGRARAKVELLGAKAACSPQILETLIPDLCSTDHGSGVYIFGLGVGKHNADMAGLLESVRTYIEHADRSDLSLIWVRGLIVGWKDADSSAVEAFLDDATDDVIWRDWFVELQVQSDLDAKAFDRLLRVLDRGQCPTWQFRYLAMGGATKPLTVSQIMVLVNKLILRSDHGLATAMHILTMVIYCADENNDQYKNELSQALLKFFGRLDWASFSTDLAQTDHDLVMVLEFALRRIKLENQVVQLLKHILSSINTDRLRFSDERRSVLKAFFRYFPKLSLEVVCTPDDDGSFSQATALLSGPYSEKEGTALGSVPTGVLINWCNENPDMRYPFAANVCKLFENREDEKTPIIISDTALSLLKSAPDKAAIINNFVRRFSPSSWSGSLADILEERLLLFDQLAISGDKNLVSALASAKTTLQNQISAQRAWEKEREKSRNSSFE